MDQDELERRYVYHPPGEKIRKVHDDAREQERLMAKVINGIPGGDTREKALAFTALETCSFWVHAHIARNLTEDDV
jgi:hypothetical protein